MLKTDNYDLNIAQGTDIVNPLVVDNPNYQKIDKVMKDNEIRGIGTATELKTGSVHSITVPEQYTTFKFVATSDFIAGETFTLNGKQVTGYTTNQQPLATNAYRIGATVLCSYIDRTSTITLYTIAPAGKAEDSEQLDGHPSSYFAVKGNTNKTLERVDNTATARGTLAQTALNNQKMEVLWENSNPRTEFYTQTVTFDTKSYKLFLIIFYGDASGNNALVTTTMMIGTTTVVSSVLYGKLIERNVNILDNSATFTRALIQDTYGNLKEHNAYLIPYKIVGILK